MIHFKITAAGVAKYWDINEPKHKGWGFTGMGLGGALRPRPRSVLAFERALVKKDKRPLTDY